jgi:hypothetical protein
LVNETRKSSRIFAPSDATAIDFVLGKINSPAGFLMRAIRNEAI